MNKQPLLHAMPQVPAQFKMNKQRISGRSKCAFLMGASIYFAQVVTRMEMGTVILM
jgi:hypothetical protein